MGVPVQGPFDIAGVCAHPDDAELIMGGTIAREVAAGRTVALVDLTRGESRQPRHAGDAGGGGGGGGARSSASATASRSTCPTRASTAGSIEQRDVIVAVLRRLRPAIVILQHWLQRHPDHAAASRLVYQASLRGRPHELPARARRSAFRPRKLVYAVTMTETTEVPPTFVVDVTATFDQKMKAIRAFDSQFVAAAERAGDAALRLLPGRGGAGRAPARPAHRRDATARAS